MIKIMDAFLLTGAKLRARRIRTSTTVLLIGLLFGLLIAGSLVINGVLNSIDMFSNEGLATRYIVTVNNAVVQTSSTSVLRDEGLIAKAKDQYQELVDKKIAEAKRLGITYNKVTDQPPYVQSPDGIERLNPGDPNGIAHALLAEKYNGNSPIDDVKLEKVARQYGNTQLFTVRNVAIARGDTLGVLPDGEEVFYDLSNQEEVNAHYSNPIIGTSLSIAPSRLTKPFIFSNNGGWTADSNALPIILPQDTAEQLFGLEKLPQTAGAADKIERTKEIRDKATNFTFQACYRNHASVDFIQKTIAQQRDIAVHNTDKGYQVPALIYKLPNASKCSEPIIQSDTRNANQKLEDENQKVFDEEFGAIEPKSYFVQFRIVGISPAQLDNNEQSRTVEDVVANLLKTNGVGQLIPEELYKQIPDKDKYADVLAYEPSYLLGSEDNKTRYIEFSRAQDAQRFIDEQSCSMQYDGTCKPKGRDYMARLAFGDGVAIRDIRIKLEAWLNWAIFGISVLATIIMWLMIARTIADGRRETAVFRALGFSRGDIALVYLIYTITLSLFIILIAGLIGGLTAYCLDATYAPQLTAQAQYMFSGLDLSKKFNLTTINFVQLAVILITCLSSGLLGMCIPLLSSMRRNPIKDMRDEG